MVKTRNTIGSLTPCVLVVDDEQGLPDLCREIVTRSVDCRVMTASNIKEAREILARQSVDLLLTDVGLPDGSGLTLLGELRRRHPLAAAMVMSGTPSVDCAVDAVRGGAVDFVTKPFSAEVLTERVRGALGRQEREKRQQTQLRRLKTAYRHLIVARRKVSKKVDLLCNDVIGAYGDLSRQMDGVRLQESFRQFATQADDLEGFLCNSMDWLLRHVGLCNIGIWLRTSDESLQLGAYMKHTVASEPELAGAMEKSLLRMAMRRGFLRLRSPDAASKLTGPELKHLGTQDIIAANCTYLGDTLGVLVLFRDNKTPFSDDEVATIRTISPLFALSLSQAVRGTPPAEQGTEKGEERDEPSAKKKDPADWWKTGEAPPF